MTGAGQEVPELWQYADTEWEEPAKAQAAMISRIDRDVGRILDSIDEMGLAGDTLIMFTSDNGPHAEGGFDTAVFNPSGPLRGMKRDLYEGGIRVPLIARWPGRIEAGQTSDHPCYFADMLPTFAELAGAPSQVPEDVDGLSFVPTLLGQASRQEMHAFMYWEWDLYDWGQRRFVPNGLMQAVRMGDWKAVRHKSDEPFELYDLGTDIGETNDVAAQHPEIVRKIEDYIARTRTEPGPQIEPEKPEGKSFR